MVGARYQYRVAISHLFQSIAESYLRISHVVRDLFSAIVGTLGLHSATLRAIASASDIPPPLGNPPDSIVAIRGAMPPPGSDYPLESVGTQVKLIGSRTAHSTAEDQDCSISSSSEDSVLSLAPKGRYVSCPTPVLMM